jgi:hypothetical protein
MPDKNDYYFLEIEILTAEAFLMMHVDEKKTIR